MSAFFAPIYYFPGIAFNSAFYNESTSEDLTLAQANALYLKKTTADTATALETFTGGIATNGIQSTTTSADMSIGSSQTDGILNLGAGGLRTATGAINIGTGGTSSPCIVNIANGGVTQAGAVNIANSFGATISTTVNIGNGNSTGGVTIGNPANNVNLNGASILIANNSVSGIVQIKNANNSLGEVQIVTSGFGTNTTPVKISTGTTSGAVTIGSSSNTTNLNSGTVNIAATSANPTNINIGASNSTGTVNILSGIGSSMNIANGAGVRTITIGNTSNVVNVANIQINNAIISSGSGTVILGVASTTLNVAGNLTLGTGKNITLAPDTGYVTPTAGQLGFSVIPIVPIGGGTPLVGTTVVRSVVITAGVWMIYGNVRFAAPGTFAELCITTLTTLDYDSASVAVGVAGMCLQVTRIVSSTTGATYNLLANAQANGAINSVGLFAYRIA